VFRPWRGSKEARRINPNQECLPRFHIHLVEGTVMTVIIGIDPHKASHAAYAIDSNEHELAQLSVRAGQRQLVELLGWARPFGVRTWAIESASGLGYLLAQRLVSAGEDVVDRGPSLLAEGDTARARANDSPTSSPASRRRPDAPVRRTRLPAGRRRWPIVTDLGATPDSAAS
jgi:Transposase